MNSKAPRISVIMPAYNSRRHISTALESVRQQTYRDYEVIVVDDGSTDDTKALVLALDPSISYLYQSNQGPSAARNMGIGVARGEFICFLDADDSWTPDKLQTQLAFMERHPEVGLAFADEDELGEGGVQCASLLSKSRYFTHAASEGVVDRAFPKLLHENFIPTSMVMVRRQCFETAGLFDVTLRASEDRDMWSRIAVHFPIAYLPKLMGHKRALESGVSRNVEVTLRSRLLMWRKARALFPELAPARTVNSLLAPTYIELGFVLLNKANTRGAREAGWLALKVARRPSQWLLALSLILFSVTGRAFADSAFRAKRWVTRTTSNVQPVV